MHKHMDLVEEISLTWLRKLVCAIWVLDFRSRSSITYRQLQEMRTNLAMKCAKHFWSYDEVLFVHLQLSGHLLSAYGYGAPEFESGIYTSQSDVYSFGVVMLELLTGRMSYDR